MDKFKSSSFFDALCMARTAFIVGILADICCDWRYGMGEMAGRCIWGSRRQNIYRPFETKFLDSGWNFCHDASYFTVDHVRDSGVWLFL